MHQHLSLPQQVADIVGTTPVFDIHTHLYDPAFGGLLLWGIDELLVYHYLVAEGFRHFDLPYEKFWALSKTQQADLIWDALFIKHSPISEACRGVLTVLHLLGLDVQKRDLPALDDSLAQTAGDYETLDALKNEIRGELLEAAKRETDNKYSDECVDALVKQATVEFAPQMVKAEVDELYERTERRIKEQKMDMAQYLEMLSKTEDQYREELKPTAEVRLRRGLALAELTKLESITVSDEEVEQQIDRLAASYGPQSNEARKALSSESARESIKIDLITQAGLTRLMAICKGEA